MAAVATKSDPDLWRQVKAEVQAGDKGGEPGQWSARKAQFAVQEYKRRGGGYIGRKTADNHLAAWQREDWGTRSGLDSRATGERYLPKAVREALTSAEYQRTSAKKRADRKAGHQSSRKPADIAAKTSRYRERLGGRAALRASGVLPDRAYRPR
jgi:hypothetical protein